MINAQELQGQWNQIRGELRQRWGQLTDDDLDIQNGNIDQLIGRIQQKTGQGREAIENVLTELTSGTAGTVSRMAESAREYAQQTGGRIRESYDQIADRARQTYGQAEEMVRERPVQSIGTAFAAGVLVGLVLGITLSSSR